MKQNVGKLRLALLSLLALIVCATAMAFIGVNYGDKLTASAAVNQDENGNYILDNNDYFITSDGGKTITGLSEMAYGVLGSEVQSPGAITRPFVVRIPEGVTKFTAHFTGCTALKGITMPQGFEYISSDLSDTEVRSLAFPKSIKTIGNLIAQAPYLESVTVEEYTAEELAAGAVQTFYSVNDQYVVKGSKTAASGKALVIGAGGDVTVTSDITKMEMFAFRYRKTLRSITIPASVTNIGELALSATALERVTIDKANTVYSDGSNLDAAGNIVASGAVAGGNCIITKSASGKFDSLFIATKSSVVPSCITNYKGTAYKGVLGITDIAVPAQITKIEGGALSAAELETIRVEEGNTAYFSKVNGVETNCVMQNADSKQVGEETHYVMIAGSASSQIPDCVYKLGTCAFESSPVTSITVPESVTKIDSYCFYGSKLNDISLGTNITAFGTEPFGNTPYINSPDRWDNGVVNYIDCYLVKASDTLSGRYKVKDGTAVIVGAAFRGCASLTVVDIPENVKYIGEMCFTDCTNLNTVYVPSTLEEEGNSYNVFPSQTKLIAADKTAYDNLKAGALRAYASQMGYPVDVTLKVGKSTVTVKKLAGQTLGYEYNEATGEWIDTGEFSAGGFSVDKWKDASGNVVTLNGGTAMPADATALTYTAVDDSGNELETVTKLAKPNLTDGTLTYGESFTYPMGYNQSLMNVSFIGTDVFGEAYDSTEAPKNAGAYTVSITPVSGYTWSDGTVAAVTARLTIDKKLIEELNWYNLEHLYDGKVPQVWAEIATSEGTMVVKPAVTATDAGKYSLSVTLPDKCNYRLAASANSTAELKINPRTVKIVWTGMTDYKWVYDGEAHNPTATMSTDLKDVNVEYGVKITDNTGAAAAAGAIEAGSYVMTVTLKNDGTNGNFVFEDGTFESTCNFTILEKVKLQIVWENVGDVTYDGAAHNPRAYYTLGNSGEKHYLPVTLKSGSNTVTDAINAGSYTASVDVSGITAPDGSAIAAEDISGDREKTFTIAKQNVTIEWFSYNATVAYDGKAHNPVAFYTAEGSGWFIKLEVAITGAGGAVENATEAGTYTATVTSDLTNFNVTGDTSRQFTIEAQQTQVTQAVWTGTTTFAYTGEEQSPVATLLNAEGEDVNADGRTVYSYATASGAALKGAPVKVGSYKVTATFLDKNDRELATASYDYEIVKAKVVKPVVTVSTFASLDAAKAYVPVGYDANTMVMSGAESDGAYELTVALKDAENYEWSDGRNEAENFTLKISPEAAETAANPVTAIIIYVLIGVLALVAALAVVALVLALRKKEAVTEGGTDGDGFYDDYET